MNADGVARVEELWVYPLKSAAGIPLDRIELDEFGPTMDRRWILIDGDGRFMSQRTHLRMALLRVEAHDGGVTVLEPGGASCTLPTVETGPRVDLTLWGRPGHAVEIEGEPGRWMTEWFGEPVRVGFMPPGGKRTTDPAFLPGRAVSFADGYPFLMVSTASLAELNRRAGRFVEMTRFRPNIVVSGCGPHEEDQWRRVRVGEVPMTGVKPCPRCVATTVDPTTAERGPEPLATLRRYRMTADGIFFGQNLAHDGRGTIRVGDEVEVLEMGPPPVGPRGAVAETGGAYEE
jgi:uncharacterized protein YcbX